MRFVPSRKSNWGGVWGRLLHVNTWSWSRAVEPWGRVGVLAPQSFQYPKSACLSTKCPFPVLKNAVLIHDISKVIPSLPPPARSVCYLTLPLYLNRGYTGTGVAKKAQGSSPFPPFNRRVQKWEGEGKVGDWSMPLHITYP